VGADLDGEAAVDQFGISVSLSADGSRLAAGGYWNDGSNGSNAGHVRVFDWNGSAWVQVGADIDGEAAEDQFGQSVSLSADGSRLAAGGWLHDGNGINAGHVRVFDAPNGESEHAGGNSAVFGLSLIPVKVYTPEVYTPNLPPPVHFTGVYPFVAVPA